MTAQTCQNDIPMTIIKEAAMWLIRIQEQPLNQPDQLALSAWRGQSYLHEQAWQRAEQLGNKIREIPSAVGMKVLDRPASVDRRQFTKHIVLLLTVAPTSVMAYKYLPWQGLTAEFKTAKGEQQTLHLADGSQIILNTDSAVDVEFNQHKRLIKLHHGEIYITTAHDAKKRPLLVETSDGQLHALGTKFVVHTQAENSYLGVLEGAVDILPKNNPLQHKVIKAGQQTMFSATQINQHEPLDDNASAWIEGAIYADNIPLPQFVSMLTRYRTGIIQCDASCNDVLVSGVFQLDNPDRILQILEETRPIHIEWRSRYWAMVTKK